MTRRAVDRNVAPTLGGRRRRSTCTARVPENEHESDSIRRVTCVTFFGRLVRRRCNGVVSTLRLSHDRLLRHSFRRSQIAVSTPSTGHHPDLPPARRRTRSGFTTPRASNRPPLLRRLKVFTLNAADRAGLFALAANSRWRQNRLVILCYHGVSVTDEHEWSDVHITQERLTRRFETLRELGCPVLPLVEAIERLKVGELEGPSVVVTFDEGLSDFYAKAYPLLKTFAIPATLYVPTYYSNFQRPIFDLACSYFLWRGRGRMIDSSRLLHGSPRVRIPLSPALRGEMHLNMRAHVYTLGYTAVEKDQMLAELAEQVGVDWEEFLATRSLQLMSPAELSSLDTDLVDVQLHTHRHRTPRSESMFAREVTDNIDALAAMGFPPSGRRHFCYPSGDADPAFFPWLEALGIESATTCEPAYVTRATPLLNLPRVVDTMAVTDVEFRAWITGVARLLPRRRYRRHSDVELGTDVWTRIPERDAKVIPIRDHVRPQGAAAAVIEREVPISLAPRHDRPSPRGAAASDALIFRHREPRRADPTA